MKTKIFIILFLVSILPHHGCKIRQKYKASQQYNLQLRTQKDSIANQYKNTLSEFINIKRLSEEQNIVIRNLHEKYLAENIKFESERVTKPVEIKGQSFKTAFTANWALDSVAARNGKLVYFDVDNPEFKAKIYKDSSSNQMMFEIQTKDKTIEVPVDKVKFESSKVLQQKDSSSNNSNKSSNLIDSGGSKQTERSGSNTNLKVKSTKVESGQNSKSMNTETSFLNGWHWVALGLGVILALYTVIKTGWLSKLKNWISRK